MPNSAQEGLRAFAPESMGSSAPASAKTHLSLGFGKIIMIVGLIGFAILFLLAYFPDIPIPFTNSVFMFIEPVRRQYAKIYLFFFAWIFVQVVLLLAYGWLVKSVFGLVTKIKGGVERIVKLVERVGGSH
jgi:hypothetical protein